MLLNLENTGKDLKSLMIEKVMVNTEDETIDKQVLEWELENQNPYSKTVGDSVSCLSTQHLGSRKKMVTQNRLISRFNEYILPIYEGQ